MNRYVAELVGTFVLVFASCGSAVLAGDKIGFLGVSLAFGLSLVVYCCSSYWFSSRFRSLYGHA